MNMKSIEVRINKGYLVDISLNKFVYKNMNCFNIDKSHDTVSFTIEGPMAILLARVWSITNRSLRRY